MTSILTGDIIKSRAIKNPDTWLSTLKNALTAYMPDTTKWAIYRGDSFQLEIEDISDSFRAALYVKACLKTIKNLDVRIGIGIGKKTFTGSSIVESNGEAFEFSGGVLETLKKEKVNLKIRTTNSQLNHELNLYFKFALTIMDHWTVSSAEIVKLYLEQPHAVQHVLGQQIGINQNAVSGRQKRAHLDLVMELEQHYRQKTKQLLP